VAVVDGLVTSPPAMVAEAGRLRLVVLLHMPVGGAVEHAVLHAADAVVATSRWSQQWVLHHHGLVADRVRVALPGVDRGRRVVGTTSGGNLLCVGPVTPDKGYDVLVEALHEVHDLDWRCRCVGAVDLDPEFFAHLTAATERYGIADRVTFTGPVSFERLDVFRSETDLVVAPSRRESYGMAVAEGLARAVPVIASDVGGQAEAVGGADDGAIPGRLVPTDDTGAVAEALRRWLTEPEVRDGWRGAAANRRRGVGPWTDTARAVGEVLMQVGRVNRTAPGRVSPTRHWPDE
jgi:glycosyltransferase involved in cell wall biosynthesis